MPAAPCFWEQIELAGVTHAYRREGQPNGFVLGPIDVTIHRGQIVFIIGGNGSGKTTLAKLITGLYLPESGEVRWTAGRSPPPTARATGSCFPWSSTTP